MKTKKKKTHTRIGKASKATRGVATAGKNQKARDMWRENWNAPRDFGRRYPDFWYYVNRSGAIDIVVKNGQSIASYRLRFAQIEKLWRDANRRRAGVR